MSGNNNHQFQVRIKVIEAHGLIKRDKKDQSDPFVMAKLKGIKQMMSSVKTAVINNNPNPIWNQELDLYVPSVNDVLLLKVYDKDTLKNSLLGMVEVPLSKFYQTGASDQWLQLMKRKGAWKKIIGTQPIWFTVPGSLHVQIWFGSANDTGFTGFGAHSIQGSQLTNSGFNNTSSNSGFNNTSSSTGYSSTPMTGMSTGMGSGMATSNMTTTPMVSTPMTNAPNTSGLNSGMNSGMNSGLGMTPMTSGMDSGMNSGLGTTPMTSTSMDSTSSMNSTVTPVRSADFVDLESPNYHADDWSSKDSSTGFQPVSPARFQWYSNSTANPL